MSISLQQTSASFAHRTCFALAISALAFAGGCIPRENKWEGINRISHNGSDLYFKAKADYDVIRAQDPNGEVLKTEMESVMSALDASIVNDPKCPLFASKRGEMFLELGPDGYKNAEANLQTSVTLSEDWAAGWILLADLESRRGRTDRARDYLASAERAIESIRQKGLNKPIYFSVLGLTVDLLEPDAKRPDDPALEENQRQALLLTWLQENEQWSIDSPTLLMPVRGVNGAVTVNSANLFRRLHARIEFEKIVALLREGSDPRIVIPMFDAVFDWDPDYFPARIEKAEQLRRAGQPREAERMLRPYLASQNPKIASNGRLLYEMGAIYTDWYAISGADPHAEEVSRLAEQCFTRLLQANEQHGSAWVKRAELYTIAGSRSGRADTLKDAGQWLANAREVLKTETPEIHRIAQQLSQATAAASTTRPATKEAAP